MNALSLWYATLAKKYPVVKETEWQLLDKLTKVKTIRKGENFLQYGKVSRHAAFVVSGHFKFSIVDDNANEHIIRFGFADDLLANCESFYQKQGSTVCITALEDSVIRRFDIKKIQPLYDLHMCIAAVNLKIYQELAEQNLEHQQMLSLKSPVKRYEFLLKKRPVLIRKISLTNIARYLYVSREAISRARMLLTNRPPELL